MLSLRTMLTFFFCAILADTVLHRSLAFCVSKTLGIITVRDISFWLNSFVAYCRFSVCWLGTKKPKELLTRADLKGNFCIPVSLFVLSICADAHVHISSWVTGKFLIWSCTCIPYTHWPRAVVPQVTTPCFLFSFCRAVGFHSKTPSKKKDKQKGAISFVFVSSAFKHDPLSGKHKLLSSKQPSAAAGDSR